MKSNFSFSSMLVALALAGCLSTAAQAGTRAAVRSVPAKVSPVPSGKSGSSQSAPGTEGELAQVVSRLIDGMSVQTLMRPGLVKRGKAATTTASRRWVVWPQALGYAGH